MVARGGPSVWLRCQPWFKRSLANMSLGIGEIKRTFHVLVYTSSPSGRVSEPSVVFAVILSVDG